MKSLLLISRHVKELTDFDGPRLDYNQLAEALEADIIDLKAGQLSGFAAKLPLKLGQVWRAFQGRYEVDLIFGDSELYGLGIAVLYWLEALFNKKLAHRARLVFIGHYLSSFKKRIFFRLLPGLSKQIALIICHSTWQRDYLVTHLKLPVVLLPYQVDCDFWQPTVSNTPSNELPLVMSIGQERRDYATFIEAVADLPIRVAVSGNGYHKEGSKRIIDWPIHFLVKRWSYQELRELYGQAQIVVVPLEAVKFQAGITAILEAMAMAKPIIVSYVAGQVDVVHDKKTPKTGLPLEFSRNHLALADLETGRYVPQGDAVALRKAILDLLEQPELATKLGQNGQQVAQTIFNLDNFVEIIKQYVKNPD